MFNDDDIMVEVSEFGYRVRQGSRPVADWQDSLAFEDEFECPDHVVLADEDDEDDAVAA